MSNNSILNNIMGGIWFGLGILHMLIEFGIVDGEPVSNFVYALACFCCGILFLQI